jgi:hypothetical protein
MRGQINIEEVQCYGTLDLGIESTPDNAFEGMLWQTSQ